MYIFEYDTPIGTMVIGECDGQIVCVDYGTYDRHRDAVKQETPLIKEVNRQLQEYFAGERQRFQVPMAPEGTEFMKKVWKALETIPYGMTVTYGDIAAQIGNPKACRAVGGANNRNPISIIVPCHRVIGASGALTGYGGGLDIKERLLRLERENVLSGVQFGKGDGLKSQ